MGKRKDKRKKGGGGGGGTMMSMRSGMRRMVGVEAARVKKKNAVWNVVSWVLVIALAGLAIFFVARRFL